jgi:hypothetical protein
MKLFKRIILSGFIAYTSIACISAQTTSFTDAKADSAWQKLKPFFSVPAEFKNNYGTYRSPLKFYDGRPVVTAEDWQLRRKEILSHWNEMMGKWPPLVQNPEVEILETIHRENFTQYKISFCWRIGEKTIGYLLIPYGEGKMPAVIAVFYEPESAIGLKRLNLDFAYQLAKRGFVALSTGTSPIAKSKPYAQYYPNFDEAEVQPLSMLACLAANAWKMLAARPEVDSTRIGIVGHSYGSKWAMFASCLFEKFACAAWSDGGIVFDKSRPNVNYWEPWYLGYNRPPWREEGIITEQNPAKGLYPELVKTGVDLHELHVLMAPRPFLISGGSEDTPERWIPLNHTIAINKLLGYENRVGMTNRANHSPTPESNEQIYRFFEYFLKYNGLAIRKH